MPNILLGISGGIAAYKSCELVRELQRRGFTVRVSMTRAAEEFVTKLTFEALTRSPVYTHLFSDGAFGTAHIDIARWADLFLVAPTTANLLSNFATGRADDFLSTALLAFKGPVWIAPAMNSAMWENAAVQDNLKILKKRGMQVIDPISGELACGEIGVGKMAEPVAIAEIITRQFQVKSNVKGRNVVITAGPTREYMDPVRFLSNPSSGKMGIEIAREARRRGAIVTVIHGPLSIQPDFEATFIPVTSSAEMSQAVSKHTPADIFIGTAAVSDYRPSKVHNLKLKRSKAPSIEFEPTKDIIEEVARTKRKNDVVVGFAAETDSILENAKEKLKRKKLDLIVANEVDRETKGFVTDTTTAWILGKSGLQTALKDVAKNEVASELWNRIEEMYENRSKRS